ncbi:MAG: CoA-transferase [Chloroflexi bacterium]|nr:CoA-transferase [Chloroflexota bacterium]
MALQSKGYTLEEQIVCQIARAFGPDDAIGVMAITNCSLVGVALAQRLYAPNMLIAQQIKGRKGWVWLSDVTLPFPGSQPPDRCAEVPFNTEEIFELQLAGKLNVLMSPAQIDKYGNTNISVIGDWRRPTAVLAAARGVPDNTTNGRRVYYIVNNHSPRVFVEKVDFVCGYGRGPERENGTIRYGRPEKVLTNLGVLDFEERTGLMRLKSVHAGVTPQQVAEATGFKLITPEAVPETPSPTENELRLIRGVIDPRGVRRLDFAKGEAYKQVMKEISTGP